MVENLIPDILESSPAIGKTRRSLLSLENLEKENKGFGDPLSENEQARLRPLLLETLLS